jgi:hypothetical protein
MRCQWASAERYTGTPPDAGDRALAAFRTIRHAEAPTTWDTVGDNVCVPHGAVIVDLDGPVRRDAVGEVLASNAVHVGIASDEAAALRHGSLLDALSTTVVGGPATDARIVEGELGPVLAGVAQAPVAAATVVGLLRAQQGLDVWAALHVESLAYSVLQSGPEFARWLAGNPRRPVLATPDPVRIERHGDEVTVTLARSARRNAVDASVREGLLDALAVIGPNEQVVLRGEGPVTCSGGDLDEFGSLADPAQAHLLRTDRSLAWAVWQLRDRMTVHLQGACAGAGVELPAFANRVVAARGTTLRLPELTLGLLPGAGGTVSVARRASRWRCAWMVLTGLPVEARTALEWGLVDELTG